jgi:hypothetical protein
VAAGAQPPLGDGPAAAAAGVILHAAALHAGAVAVVQPVLVAGLALALPVRALLDRARPSARQAGAGQKCLDGLAGAVQQRGVVVQDVGEVGAGEQRGELESELAGVGVRG